MLINWQVRLISLNFIIIIINLRWSDNIKFRWHEIFYTGFGEGGSPQRALIARFKPNWNIKGVSMPFSSTFLGQFSLFNLMKNINQLLSTNGIEVSMWYGVYDGTLQAGDMKTIEYLPASFQHEWKQSLILGFSYLPFLIILYFTSKMLRKIRPSTIRHGNLKTEVSLWKRFKCFPSTVCRGNFWKT